VNILFIHQNFPAQYKHLAPALAEAGHQVFALCLKAVSVRGVTVISYPLLREPSAGIHPLAQEHEVKVIRGEAVASACRELQRQKGFVPDVVYVHPGWGEALFLRDVYPAAKIIVYCEYYYRLEGQDVNFDAEFGALSFEEQCRLRMKNTCNMHALDIGDRFVAPTEWQRDSYPEWARSRIEVIHEGLDFEALAAGAGDGFTLPYSDIRLTRDDDQVITYVSRSLEPLRGFHVFMRALPGILQRCPQARILIMGADKVAYGKSPDAGEYWRDVLEAELGNYPGRERVHFLGRVSYQHYLQALHASRVHVHLSYPFVLSWSAIEAVACGATPVFSDVPQIREVFPDADYVAFGDGEALVETVVRLLDSPREINGRMTPKGYDDSALREGFSLDVVLARQMELLVE